MARRRCGPASAFSSSFCWAIAWSGIGPPVPVIAVKQVEIHGRVHGPGTVQCKVPVTVSPKITGILEKLYADQGDRVRKGQLLAELDSIELKARAAAAAAARSRAQRDLARSQADLVKAQANLGLARSNYQRDLEVFKPGYISQASFDTTKAQLRVAESEVAAFAGGGNGRAGLSQTGGIGNPCGGGAARLYPDRRPHGRPDYRAQGGGGRPRCPRAVPSFKWWI